MAILFGIFAFIAIMTALGFTFQTFSDLSNLMPAILSWGVSAALIYAGSKINSKKKGGEKQALRAEAQQRREEAKQQAMERKAQQEFDSTVSKLADYVYCGEEQLAKYFMEGELPTEYRPTSLLMKAGEVVKYYGTAVYSITKTKAVGRTGGHRGASIRVAKGVTLHTGGSAGRTIYDDVTDTYNGEIVLTNQRIVFINPQKGFEVALKSVTAITPADGEIVIQAKTKAYRLTVASSEIFLGSVNQIV